MERHYFASPASNYQSSFKMSLRGLPGQLALALRYWACWKEGTPEDCTSKLLVVVLALSSRSQSLENRSFG